MSHSFVAYVDECGDDGLAHYRMRLRSGGASHWLGVGAVVWRMSRDLEAVQWAKGILADLPQRNRKLLHFKNLDHNQRVMALHHLSEKPLRIICVMAHKPSLQAEFSEKNQLYHYLCRYLVERISWLCRDLRPRAPEGDGRVKIIFARRGGMSYPDFQSYLFTMQQSARTDIRIHWPVIDIDAIEARDQPERYGLQLADLAVSGLCAGLEPDFYGNVELRYARILRNNVFQRNGNYLSYGAKILPLPGDVPVKALSEFVELFGE